MRKILATCFFFGTCVAFALAQRGGPGGGGFGGGATDPSALFDRFAGAGGQSAPVANLKFFRGIDEYVKQKGITNGQISRSAFLDFMANRDKYKSADGGGDFGGKMGKQRFGGPGGPGGQMATPGGPPTAPGAAPTPGAPPVQSIESINQAAEAEFKHRDQNGDGFLNFDEMPRSLREQMDRWDTNGDGLISLDEFKQYYLVRMQMRNNGGIDPDAPPPPITIIVEDDLDKRPTVYRAGKLPKELPTWFKELDTDKDGQVSFQEWRKGSKDYEEFKEWDRNDDGFITAEEVLSKMRVDAIAKANADLAEGIEASAAEEGGRRGKMRGPRGGGDEESGASEGKKGRFGGGGFGGPGGGNGDTGGGFGKKGGFGGFGKKRGSE